MPRNPSCRNCGATMEMNVEAQAWECPECHIMRKFRVTFGRVSGDDGGFQEVVSKPRKVTPEPVPVGLKVGDDTSPKARRMTVDRLVRRGNKRIEEHWRKKRGW